MRNSLRIKLVCAKHPKNELEFEPCDPKDGQVTGTEVSATFVIIPCRQCEYEKQNIINAIEVIQKAKKEQ